MDLHTYLVYRVTIIPPIRIMAGTGGVPVQVGEADLSVGGPWVAQGDTPEAAISEAAAKLQSMGEYVAVEATPYSIQLSPTRRLTPLLEASADEETATD